MNKLAVDVGLAAQKLYMNILLSKIEEEKEILSICLSSFIGLKSSTNTISLIRSVHKNTS